MAAQIELNEDGTFSSVIGETDISDMTYEEIQDVVEELEVDEIPVVDEFENEVIENDLENSTDILDDMGVDSMEDEEAFEMGEDFIPYDYSVMPLSAVDTDYTFSPQSWQLNLASGRSINEHYLMYGVRSGSGSYNGYWDYYLVLGDDIDYTESSDLYSYDDCDVYHYSSRDGIVTYEKYLDSGSLSGSSQVVYSDLYFDYVGVDPSVNSYPYMSIALFMMMFVLLIAGGRRNV